MRDTSSRGESPATGETMWSRRHKTEAQPAPVEPSPRQTLRSRVVSPLRAFFATQNAGAIVLVAATAVALVWANSPWSSTYEKFWTTEVAVRFGSTGITLELREWINDGLMAFFFFVVGLEIRREFDMGKLRERRRLATPVVAAIGGIIAPALIYLAFNGGTPDAKGWGIAIGTDTAFALGVLATARPGCACSCSPWWSSTTSPHSSSSPSSTRTTSRSARSWSRSGCTASRSSCDAVGVRNGIAYFAIALAFWVAVLESGIHPTIAGVALGLLATAYPPTREALQQAGTRWRLIREQPTPEFARTASTSVRLAVSPNERLQSIWQPWTVYVIVPLFALANAGVTLSRDAIQSGLTSRITLGIIFGLVIGKLVGITGATWLATRRRLGGLPLDDPLAAAGRCGDRGRYRIHGRAPDRAHLVRGRATRGRATRNPRRVGRRDFAQLGRVPRHRTAARSARARASNRPSDPSSISPIPSTRSAITSAAPPTRP